MTDLTKNRLEKISIIMLLKTDKMIDLVMA